VREFLRQSQILTTFGPGAMVDLPDRAVLIEGLQSWHFGKSREEIVEPRLVAKLRERLGLPSVRLVKPPAFDERAGASHRSIGARIFPTWFLVQETRPTGPGGQWRRRRLVRWSELVRGGFIDDEERSHRPRKVLPVRFVCGCPHGHLDDIDWRAYVHRDRDLGAKCHRRMWLEERGTSGDISETVVGCDCGIAPRPLYEALGIETRALGVCQGRRPWLGPNTEEDCKQRYRLLVRSASNAYFPQLFSVLSLPEEDPGITARLDAVWNILENATLATLPTFRMIPDVARALEGLTDDDAIGLIERRRAGGAGDASTVPVRQVEFEILNIATGTRGRDDPDSPLFAEALPRANWDPTGDPRLRAVERVVLVHRLREVLALVGFTRFEAAGTDEKGELDLEGITPAALAPEPEWFPAVENRGEGIFIVLSAEAITHWRSRDSVKQRERQLISGMLAWDAEHSGNRHWLGVPYMLLHSLSHLLLTRIALDCGYPAAALRERIYALADTGMYGLLIHTGTSDSEGTLGGLVETGRRIGEHLLAVIDEARLCSNDPVCAEHDPSADHDPMHLHGAACHGCLLIAETSCEQRNDWLDRALVVPTLATADAAFFP